MVMRSEATHHFLDPVFIAYSIGVSVAVQIVILLLALALAFITRRKVWSGVLLAIAVFWYLVIPILLHLVLPGVAHFIAVLVAVVGAFQIARSVNRHARTRLGPWFLGVPALIAVCAWSFGPVREFFQLKSLPPPPNAPNVLIIIVDTLRADHLSAYGYSRDTSPFVNQLAQQGVLFENAIAPSSWTLPSHASMLTGLYPLETRVETDDDDLSGSFPNLGDAMRNRGYRTAAFSANPQLFSRERGFIYGFSHFEGYEQSVAGILEKVPLSRVIFQFLSARAKGDPLAFFGVKNAANAARVDEDALRWIDRGRRPFFVVLNYFDLHEPVLPPDPYLRLYTTNPTARRQSMYFGDACAWGEVGRNCDSRRQVYFDTYDGATRYVDENVKSLLAELNQRGLLQNTIVVFTADHGQEIGEHGIYGHSKSLYRPEIQVPLVLWKPGLVPASIRVPTPVTTADISATILDLAAADGTHPLPGRSLAPLWRSTAQVPDWPPPISELARLHWRTKSAPNYNAPIDSIVTPEGHYIRQEGKDLLFDWKTDPGETHDLCAAQPAACSTLKNQLQTDEATSRQAH